MTHLYKFLSLGALLLCAGSTLAENPAISCIPPQGEINTMIYSAGVNAIELYNTGSINREANGYVTLSRNDVVVRRIPASNVAQLYCIDGFEKSEYGSIHVDFWTAGAYANGLIPGDYVVTYDDNVILFGDSKTPNEAFSLSFKIAGAGLSITPADGATLSEISTVTLTFPEGADVELTGDASAILLENFRAPEGEGVYSPSVTIDANIATLTFAPSITDQASYFLTIPAKTFSWTINGETTSNGDIYYNYIVEVVEDMPEITPAPGEYTGFEGVEVDGVPTTTIFQLLLPEGQQLAFTSMGSSYLYPINADGTLDTSEKSYRFKAEADANDKGKVLLNTINGQTSVKPTSGEYMLVVNSDAYYLTGMVSNKQMQFGPYTIVEGESNLEFTSTPAYDTPVENLSEIILEFADDAKIEWGLNSYATLTNGVTVYALQPEAEANKLTFPVLPVATELGEWVLTIPQTALTIDGQASALKITYTISESVGVSTIENVRVSDIYTITGMKVNGNAENLAPGLYIINGKKVIRK